MTDVLAHMGAPAVLIGRRGRRPMQSQALILQHAVNPARNRVLTAQGRGLGSGLAPHLTRRRGPQ